jgi:lincosamide and streptogramin A transport system ATP-binding/permease protein
MGQQRKLAIARSLCEPANVYLWDEPLNYLDVITRQEIETLITEVQPTMIVIDHDATFTEAIGTKYLSI